MKLELYCIKCIISQTLEVLDHLQKSKFEREQILRKILRLLARESYDKTSPELAEIVYGEITKLAGVDDPYKEEKRKQNELALKIIKNFEQDLQGLSLIDVLKLSVLGNSIDYGTEAKFDVERELKDFMKGSFPEETTKEFLEDLSVAKKMLIIGDNAGEIVFDRLLIRYLKFKKPELNIVYAVRSGPIINDATLDDAKQAELDKWAKIITTGQKIAGLVLERASEEIKQHLRESDLILSKGQGNFETLEDKGLGIYFLFRVKCPVVGRNLNKKIGEIAFLRR